jgi:large subunit ribosomal protein L21
MFAIIETGGKQYNVTAGSRIKVEKLAGEVGDQVVLDRVLAAGEQIGAPLVDKAKVGATIVEQGRSDKVIVFKKRRRQKYRRTQGHRQHLTTLEITKVAPDGKLTAPKKKSTSSKAKAADTSAEQAAETTGATETQE